MFHMANSRATRVSHMYTSNEKSTTWAWELTYCKDLQWALLSRCFSFSQGRICMNMLVPWRELSTSLTTKWYWLLEDYIRNSCSLSHNLNLEPYTFPSAGVWMLMISINTIGFCHTVDGEIWLTTWDGENRWINYLSTGAGFQPST